MKDENVTVSYTNNEEVNEPSKFEEAYQAHERQKKAQSIISLIAAGAILVGGTTLAIKMKSKKVPVDPEITTTMVDNQNEVKLLLSEDFDINNKDAVEKRAKEIFSYMNKESNDSNKSLEITINDIKNILYCFNDRPLNIIFQDSLTEEAKFKYLQELLVRYYELLCQNLYDDSFVLVEEIDGNVKSKVKDDNEIFAYMFMAKGEKEANSDKQIAINYAKIVYEQLEDIKNGNVKDFSKNAEDFYNFIEKFRNNKSISNNLHVLIKYDIQSKYPMFRKYLNKNQIEELLRKDNNYVNIIMSQLAQKLGISEYKNDGCDPVLESNSYVASDAAKANALIGGVVGEAKTSVESKGGQKVRTESKVISQGTTKVESHTFIAKPEVTTGTYTVVEPGGKVIGEIDYTYVDDNDDWKKYLDEETTTKKDEQPTYIIVDQGGKKLN